MKKYIFLYLIPFLFGCNSTVKPQNKNPKTERDVNLYLSPKEISYNDYLTRIDTIILGDINFDNIIDTAIIYPVQFINPNDIMMGCFDDFPITKIHFSHDDSWLIKPTAIDIMYFSVLDDLNEDGVKEIALIPSWYSSCNSGFYVFSNHNGIWQKVSGTGVFSCGETDFEVIKSKKNQFIVPNRTYSEAAGDLIDTTKTVNFPKFEPDIYDVIVDSIDYPILETIALLKPHLIGLVAFYSGIAGSQCDIDGEETCELTRALKLGKQGSKKQLDLIKTYFPNDTIAEMLILQKCYREPSGASISHEFSYLKIKDFGNKVVVEYEIMLYNRGTFTHSTYADSYLFDTVFSVLERKLISKHSYTFEDMEIN